MPKNAVSGDKKVPKIFWIMVGGDSLSPPPTWNRFLSMMDKHDKLEREARAGKEEFKIAKKQAKEELEAIIKSNKETFKGGLAAWRQRKRETKTNSDEEYGAGTGREARRPEENNAGNDGTEANG
ncbi:hypothetical protein QIS74_08986 [Colletotrichum tabaci]|uniref:Uncharacterized protein n=1 Tax=Colletotrichum tabaci TaxID=1209068 RepID=A0AAV9T435_9PEZI